MRFSTRSSTRRSSRSARLQPSEAISHQPLAISHTMFFSESFSSRHIGPDAGETAAMLKAVGAKSLDALIDEATAAAEAMTMLHRVQAKRIDAVVGPAQFFVSDRCFAQTIDLLKTRAEPMGIELVIGDLATAQFGDRVFGALVQTPDESGCVHDLTDFIARAKRAGVAVAVGTDLLSLTLLTPPGEMGADVVYGNSQRFGVPLGYGGPHAAFFATLERHVRQAPGRIIGVSIDVHGNTAYRMALQTREQHIRP